MNAACEAAAADVVTRLVGVRRLALCHRVGAEVPNPAQVMAQDAVLSCSPPGG